MLFKLLFGVFEFLRTFFNTYLDSIVTTLTFFLEFI